jgi:hypothetical protein
MHYQNSTTYFHRVCIQSGIVRKKLGFEARCYIIVIYLNVGYNIAIYLNVGTLIIDAINVKIQLSPWLTISFSLFLDFFLLQLFYTFKCRKKKVYKNRLRNV